MPTRHRGFTRKKFLDAVGPDLLLRFLGVHCNLHASIEDVASKSGHVHSEIAEYFLDEEKVDRLLDQGGAELQSQIHEDLQCINDVSDKAMDYLVAACAKHEVSLTDGWPNERLAMLLFLDFPTAFRMAYDLYTWRASSNTMAHHQFKQSRVDIDDDAIARFKASVEAFFQGQGKGNDCKIRHYEDEGDRLILIARGDHIQALSVWEGGDERTTFPRPVREDLLRFNPHKCILSIKAFGRSRAEPAHYVEAWETHVLRRSQAELFTHSVVSLDPIRSGKFRYDGNDEIEWVRLVDLRFVLMGRTPITLRVSSDDVMKSLEADLRTIRLSAATLKSAKLSFKLKYEGASTKPLLVEVTPPNVTKMNRKKDERIITSYLRAEGVLLA
jgi:hypothetical protein